MPRAYNEIVPSPSLTSFLDSHFLASTPSSFCLQHICVGNNLRNVYPPFLLSNKRTDYIPSAKIVYSNRFINMHVYITSLFSPHRHAEIKFGSLFFFSFFFFVCMYLCFLFLTHSYVVYLCALSHR